MFMSFEPWELLNTISDYFDQVMWNIKLKNPSPQNQSGGCCLYIVLVQLCTVIGEVFDFLVLPQGVRGTTGILLFPLNLIIHLLFCLRKAIPEIISNRFWDR